MNDQPTQPTEAPSELEAVRASAQEWASIAEHWMHRHDKLLDFIRADPDRLKALHAWQSWEVSWQAHERECEQAALALINERARRGRG
jgi:hypothetical protein